MFRRCSTWALVALLPLIAACSSASPNASVACGPRRCDPRTTYCEIVLSDAPSLPSDYTCRPLPDRCKSPRKAACSCLPETTRCAHMCGFNQGEDGSANLLRVTCVGGA